MDLNLFCNNYVCQCEYLIKFKLISLFLHAYPKIAILISFISRRWRDLFGETVIAIHNLNISNKHNFIMNGKLHLSRNVQLLTSLSKPTDFSIDIYKSSKINRIHFPFYSC